MHVHIGQQLGDHERPFECPFISFTAWYNVLLIGLWYWMPHTHLNTHNRSMRHLNRSFRWHHKIFWSPDLWTPCINQAGTTPTNMHGCIGDIKHWWHVYWNWVPALLPGSPLCSGETFSLPCRGSLRNESNWVLYGVTSWCSKPIVLKQWFSGSVCGGSDKLQLR